MGFPGGSVVKDPPANAGDARDAGLIPRSGRSPGGGNDNPLQYSCLENSKDRGAWLVIVYRVAESDMTGHIFSLSSKHLRFTALLCASSYHWAVWME